MKTWEEYILTLEPNVDFLEELNDLDYEDVPEALHDACILARDEAAGSDEYQNGLAAATVVAIWAGATFSAAEVLEDYPFIRANIGHDDEDLYEIAAELLEAQEGDYDLEAFLEALA